MTSSPMTITVYFDFLCPFAYRTSQWLDNVQQEPGENLVIDWKYFSLEQSNTPETANWNIWEQPEDYVQPQQMGQHNRGLLAFWGAEAARQQGDAAFNRFRTLLYHARHRDTQDISQRRVVEAVATQVELDMEQFARDFLNRHLVDAVRRDFEAGQNTCQVFGVPTICFDSDNAVFVKMMTVPSPAETLPFFSELHANTTRWRWLAEVKRPNPGDLY